MANLFVDTAAAVQVGSIASGTPSSQALNAALVFGTSGNFSAFSFIPTAADTVTDAYFFVSAINGTLGNITCTVEIRTDNSAKPSSTVSGTTTCAVNGANTWAHANFATPVSVTAGLRYWVTISNSSAAPTVDYPTVMFQNSAWVYAFGTSGTTFGGVSSTNGGTSTGGGSSMVGVLKLATAGLFGQPYTSSNTSYTSNTRERGFYIVGASASIGLWMCRFIAASSVNGFKVVKSTTAPGSTPGTGEYTGTLSTALTGGVFPAAAIVPANQDMRVLCTFSASSGDPRYLQIQDYSRYADVQATAAFRGGIYSTIDNGSGGWTDEKDKFPNGILMFSQFGGGGGASGGLIRVGMNGGFGG